MSYRYMPLSDYRRQWMFNHHEMPVADEDKAHIHPLSAKSAMEVWNRWISNKSSCAEEFTKGDWAIRSASWHLTDNWQNAWDSDAPELPLPISEFIGWDDDEPVFFCIEKYDILETRWGIFKQHWKCFLFCDDGPMLIHAKHRQAIWFTQDGNYRLGLRG
ncbi:DUF2947 domain-containing protein [Shewanella sp. YIC-542]|uniref:DUF2947 domain-containing protein n=1 Tax=Shewanella mytili TaxID=3377111 RepID=UPI00398E402A